MSKVTTYEDIEQDIASTERLLRDLEATIRELAKQCDDGRFE